MYRDKCRSSTEESQLERVFKLSWCTNMFPSTTFSLMIVN